ncbi:MAG TPA: tetratricopeptide repeat protein [bacterium]|nr:tetratricopeptide repeat protein [bacterium]
MNPIEQGPDTLVARSQAAVRQARVHRDRGDVDTAAYLYAHALEWAETAEARAGLAWTLAYAGKLDEAARECRRAILAEPDDGRACNDLGVYLMQSGEDEQAMVCLEQAASAKRNPDRHFPWYNMGRIHERRGEIRLAQDCYYEAVRLEPAFEAAERALERMRRKAH